MVYAGSATEILSKAHSNKVSLSLSDIYVNPSFKKYEGSKDEINDVDFSDIVDTFDETAKVLIAGEGQSGKTALCKRFFIELFNRGFFPVYISDEFIEPYNINFNKIGFKLPNDEVDFLKELILFVEPKRILSTKEIFDKYYTYEGCRTHILEYLKTNVWYT